MQFNFNAATIQPLVPFEPVPEGWYAAMITKSEMKPTKAGDGHFLELELKVQSGQYAGRSLFDRLNLNNPSQQAVELAYKQLSAICHATGTIQITDTAMLHNKPLEVRVSLRPATETNSANNEVKGYRASGSGGPLASMAPAGAPAAFAPPVGGAPPWGSSPVPQAAAAAQAQAAPTAAAGAAPPWAAPGMAPSAPVQTAPPPPPPAPAVVVFPPEGWIVHPTAVGWYYKGQEVKSEAELKAMASAAAPAVSAPGPGGATPPPWAR